MKSFKYQTMQEMFNNAFKGLHEQGFIRSVSGEPSNPNPFPMCYYRGPNGMKCGIGHCLSESDFKPDMEKRAVFSIMHDMGIQVFVKNGGGKRTKKARLAFSIQEAHDTARAPRDVKNSLIKVAEEYNLTVPEVK